MKYFARGIRYGSVESGWKRGPGQSFEQPLSVDTEPLEIDPIHGPAMRDKDVIVINASDCHCLIQGKRDALFLALSVADARDLCRDLLYHLAHTGDRAARFMLKKLYRHGREN